MLRKRKQNIPKRSENPEDHQELRGGHNFTLSKKYKYLKILFGLKLKVYNRLCPRKMPKNIDYTL